VTRSVKQAATRGKSAAGAESGLARLWRLSTDFLLGRDIDDETAARLGEIKGLALIGFSLYLLLALLSFYWPAGDAGARGWNWGGKVGAYFAKWSLSALGWASFLLCFLGCSWGLVLLARKKLSLPTLRILGGAVSLFSVALLLQLGLGSTFESDNRLPYGPGGYPAMTLVGPASIDAQLNGEVPILIDKFGLPGLWVLLLLTAVVSTALATEFAFYPALSALNAWLAERREKRGESLPSALWGWTRRTVAALWDFLRGRDLETGPNTELKPAARRRAAATAAADEEDTGPARTGELDFDAAAGADGAAKKPTRSAAKRVGAAATEAAADRPTKAAKPIPEVAGDSASDDEDDELSVPRPILAPPEDIVEDDEDRADAEALTKVEGGAAESGKRRRAKAAVSARDYEPPTPPKGPWKFPPLELLEPPSRQTADDEKQIEAQARKLEQALASFRVEAQVVGAKVGPTVTLFELEVSQGTRLNKVTQLSSEIAATLRARSVRIIAPIPGKATIGVEVPNPGRRIVRISELVVQKAYDTRQIALPFFLGMDTEGNPMVEDLAKMPHLLIAGTTGSGKSVCINTILASTLLTRSPHDVKLILIDPKQVELAMFANVPHLMLPVVTDAKHATQVLLWVVEKMEGRYELFKNAGVRNIKGYNAMNEAQLRTALGDNFDEERTPRHVPYIVLVVDEMADLMMTAKKEAEMAITRLAQKSRAVGIHVIVATQRPSTDVITGVIKGNLPTRIAFQVASKIDSRVILDSSGAEKLLGQGDMLYTPPSSSQIRRVQGALVEDHELQKLVDFVCLDAAPNFSQEMVQVAAGKLDTGAEGPMNPEEDELWDEAVRVILKSRRGSASLLQRALGVGYTRASRLIDMMTAERILGEFKGSKAREVLLTLEQWEKAHGKASVPDLEEDESDEE
jgi:S-DNA-T family DNA segregation ATPase FtsK/SpoIIIE